MANVKFSMAVPQNFLDGRVDMELVRRSLQRGEELGYEGAWVQDQVTGEASLLESVSLLCYAAAVTTTMKLGVSVIVFPIRNAVQLAKSVGTSNSQLPGDHWFDADEFGMFDFFGAGNGTVYGCTGTYRNGSDVASGLIYAGTDIINWPTNYLPCADALRALDMMGNPIDPKSGFKGSDWAGGGLRHPRIVEFNFTPGKFAGMTFGFDADLDGTLNTLRFAPPLLVSEAEIDEAVDILKGILV